MNRALRITITGRVQGVGFRYWVLEEATALSLSGWVRNRRDGSVEAVISGPSDRIDAMLARCRSGPAAARVVDIAVADTSDTAPSPFEIRATI